ncbi:MAG: type VI secretion system protein TssA [Methylococcaceae bacterium]|jgi:type VI secretion system protein ImpA
MFDYKELIKPISDNNPYGEDISFSREIDAISEARRFDDATLDQGDWVTDIKLANWPFVIENCSTLLASKSKDLRLAVWLAEASAKVYQFAGLAEGYLLLADLCDKYWEGIYPLPDDVGQEQRSGNIHWLLTRSIQLIKEMPITENYGITYSILDYEVVSTANVKANATEQEGGEEAVKYANFEIALRKGSKSFYKKLLEDIQFCKLALNQLEHSVDTRLGLDGPSFSAAKEAIENAQRLIVRFVKELGLALVEEDELTGDSAPQPVTPIDSLRQPATNIQMATVIHSREQALSQLRLIADYFKRAEPHSPVAYLAEKAAAWGEMPLHHWLASVIKDPTSLSHIQELLGMVDKPSQED